MDESWRMRMGTSNGGTHRRRVSGSDTGLDPEDFDDVFGGPPRSVLARKQSGDEFFYQEVFRCSESRIPVTKEGLKLNEFMIPEQRRSKQKGNSSMSKSKSTSSSVLSFEELSPFRSTGVMVGQEDVALSSFTSRLRPIHVPYRWSTTSPSTKISCNNKKQDLPAFGCNASYNMDNSNNQFTGNNIKSFIFGFPHTFPTPETINYLDSNTTNMQLMVDYHPPSENMTNFSFEESISYRQQSVKTSEHEDDDIMSSSYIIEVNSHTTEANNSEAIDIDEAIAWAKEKFHG